MSRTNLLFLLTITVMATVLSGAPSPVPRSSFSVASVTPFTSVAMLAADPAAFPLTIDQP